MGTGRFNSSKPYLVEWPTTERKKLFLPQAKALNKRNGTRDECISTGFFSISVARLE